MLSAVRRRLAMAVRVRDFCRAHPSDDPTYLSVLGSLEERLVRADALAIQQRAGTLTQHAATLRRRELRRRMQDELLPQLVMVGEEVGLERADLAGRFRLPASKGPHKAFVTAVKGMLALVEGARELFVGKGVSEEMLAELGRLVAEFDEATEDAHGGRRDHVGATADLKETTDEISRLVGLLNGLNRFRFRGDPELKAAWKSATVVIGPFRSTEVPGSAGGVTPPEGGIASAA